MSAEITPQMLSLRHLLQPARQSPAPGVRSPLLVLLHGVGSNEGDLFGLAPYLDGRFTVVSARGPITIGPRQYGWYQIEWTPEGPIGDDAQAETSRAAILRFLPEAAQAYNADPEQIYLMGFSQGAILSLLVALPDPRAVAGIVPMSGRLLPQALEHRAPDADLAGLPVFAVHGTQDAVLPIVYGREIRDALSRLPIDLTYREYEMAHQVSNESLADIAAWLTARLDER